MQYPVKQIQSIQTEFFENSNVKMSMYFEIYQWDCQMSKIRSVLQSHLFKDVSMPAAEADQYLYPQSSAFIQSGESIFYITVEPHKMASK